LFISQISILNIVQYNLENTNMQTILVENLALTFVGDARALVTGLGRILVKLVTAPIEAVTVRIERIARACDVASVLPDRRAKANAPKSHSRQQTPTTSRRWCLFPFHSMNHLT
jgi:hypothetical protein